MKRGALVRALSHTLGSTACCGVGGPAAANKKLIICSLSESWTAFENWDAKKFKAVQIKIAGLMVFCGHGFLFPWYIRSSWEMFTNKREQKEEEN
jgi:hypothetical protein